MLSQQEVCCKLPAARDRRTQLRLNGMPVEALLGLFDVKK
jgi:hypothetical protein